MIWVDDLANPEGPVLLADGSWALVEMHVERGWLLHLSADGRERKVIAKTGRPNGLCIDTEGTFWVAESVNPPSLLRVRWDGESEAESESAATVEVVLTGDSDGAFLFPNDLAFGPDGALYMTDSGVAQGAWRGMTHEERVRQGADGRLYRVDLDDMSIEKLDSGLAFANGIAFGPDDAIYVSTTLDGKVFRYEWNGGEVGPRELFGDLLDPGKSHIEGLRGGDGMAFGEDGNLYCTVVGQGDVTVLGRGGEVADRIQLAGPAPTNVAFGPDGEKKIYVTEQGVGHFEVHEAPTAGAPLYYG
ncbi:MAG: SMP-30/gluconolactonase/LRE family protein [Chloroflexi bacterium]|nr:SMP-30/gluconolactonase/LRE family protein [Chloroflexota bacterium]